MWFDPIECAAIKGKNIRNAKNCGMTLDEYLQKENEKADKKHKQFLEDLKYRGKPIKSLVRWIKNLFKVKDSNEVD